MTVRSGLVLAVLAAAVACGRGPGPADRVTGAPDLVRQAGTASMVMTIDTSLQGAGEADSYEQRTVAEATVDFEAERGTMDMELTIPEGLLDDVELRPCRILLDGTVIYLSVGEGQAPFEGRPWVRAEAGQLAGFDVGTFGASDPTAPLEYLKGAGDEVQEVGTEEVRDVQTTRYRATVSEERLLERADPERREQLGSQLQQLGRDLLPVDVWIDDEGLVRRMRLSVERTGEAVARTVMTMELFDYGEPVDVDYPSGDQVFETDDPEVAQSASTACLGLSATGDG